jgi:hypothetical protein
MLAISLFLSMLGITIWLRSGYIFFADPILPVLIAVMHILAKLMVITFKRLADVKVKRFGWRGLWVTRLIEGTVDDDVAAKLAIGEGRQQDLEQEQLELQALSSERFRHRFLERNRPWILQHLVELLTPRSLAASNEDGRPVVEYIRDVYGELLQIGEGMRRPGDREDVSSDEEEDELEEQRRSWPKQPLTGAPLAIAKYWLTKARKRRAFSKLVRGTIDQNKQSSCDSCERTPEKNNVTLTVHLATRATADPHAIDRLIARFEEQYTVMENDPQLWKV